MRGETEMDARMVRLMEEFLRRQRERPELVVRPWWTADRGVGGFMVEYCPGGVESAELAVRPDRVRIEGPTGLREGRLELASGWWLDGTDCRSPETVASRLLWMADAVLGEDGQDAA